MCDEVEVKLVRCVAELKAVLIRLGWVKRGSWVWLRRVGGWTGWSELRRERRWG